MVDLRPGNKPDVFVGETKGWPSWPSMLRHHINALDEEMHEELLTVDGAPTTARPLTEMAADTANRAWRFSRRTWR